MGWMIGGGVVVFLGLIILVTGFFTVQQQTTAIIERLGRFHRICGPGPSVKLPLLDTIAGRISHRLRELEINVDERVLAVSVTTFADRERKLAYRGQFDDSRPGNGRPVTGADLRRANLHTRLDLPRDDVGVGPPHQDADSRLGFDHRFGDILGLAEGAGDDTTPPSAPTGIVVVPLSTDSVETFPATSVAVIALTQWGWGPEFFWLLGAYAIIQALDGNLLVPLLFSEVVNLHPVAIILAILVFGGLWGFWGIFFAIPLATFVKAVLNAWPRKEKPGDEPEDKGEEATA